MDDINLDGCIIEPGDLLAFNAPACVEDDQLLHDTSFGVYVTELLVYVGAERFPGKPDSRFWFLSVRFGLCFKWTNSYLTLVQRRGW